MVVSQAEIDALVAEYQRLRTNFENFCLNQAQEPNEPHRTRTTLERHKDLKRKHGKAKGACGRLGRLSRNHTYSHVVRAAAPASRL